MAQMSRGFSGYPPIHSMGWPFGATATTNAKYNSSGSANGSNDTSGGSASNFGYPPTPPKDSGTPDGGSSSHNTQVRRNIGNQTRENKKNPSSFVKQHHSWISQNSIKIPNNLRFFHCKWRKSFAVAWINWFEHAGQSSVWILCIFLPKRWNKDEKYSIDIIYMVCIHRSCLAFQ